MQPHIINGIGHFDVSGPDAGALHGFYAAVFGWTALPKGPGYALLQTPDDSPNGAIVEAEAPAITIGVVVPDLDASLAAALASGGSVAMPVTDNGWVRKAVVADPAGNRITLIAAGA